MKLKNILTKLSFLVVLFTFIAGTTFAQTNWYVNSTGGIDNINVYDGKSPSQPFATIGYAISKAADGDIIYVAAGTYPETQVTVSNKSLTFITYVFNNSNTVNITQGFKVNASGKTVNLGVTGGVFNLGVTDTALVLTAGTLNITSANVVLGANATLTRGDGTINTTPTYSGKINIKYTNTADINSGAELPANLNGGTLEGAMSSNKKVTIITPVTVGAVKTDANSTFSLAANIIVTTDIDNSGKIFANGYKITLAPTADITLTKLGNIYSVTAGTPGNGIVELTGSKNITTDVNSAILPNLSMPASFTGNFVVKANLTLEGDLTLAGGKFDASTASVTVEIKGNLYRTNNTVGNFLLDNDLLKFSGANDVTFNPGANLTLYNLEIAKNTGKKVTLTASVEMNGDLNITSGQLELGSNNIYMKGANKTFTNSGNFYSTSGNGFIVFQNNSTIFGGGTFGNILVEDTVNVNSDINFSGILYINKGTFNISNAKTVNFTSTLSSPVIKINTNPSDNALFDTTGTGTATVATGTKVSLYYLGTGSYTAGLEWNLLAGNLNDVTIAVASGKKVTGPNVASTIAGTLTVNTGDTLDVSSNTYTLSGDSKTHVIKGAVVNGTLQVTGSGSAVNGSTASGDVATVDKLTFEPAADGATFTSSNLKVISGVLELQKTSTKTGASATVTLANNGTVTGNIEVGNTTVGPIASITIPGSSSTVGGNLTLNKGTLTLTVATPINAVTLNNGTLVLGSDLTVEGATSQVKGSIDAGGFKYIQKDANYTRTDNGSFTNGTLVLNAATADISLNTSTYFTVPNLNTAGGSPSRQVTISDTVEVTNSLTIGDSAQVSVVTLFKVSGANVTVNAGAGTFLGSMLLTNSAANVLLKKDYTIPTLTINSSGIVEVHSDDEDASPTARTLTVSTAFTNTAGTLAMGINHLNVTGSFTFTAGAITQTTGMLTWGNSSVIIPSSGFSIDNLTVNAAVDVGTKAFTVNKNLVLKNSLTTSADGKLTLGDGILIERTTNAATLAKLPAFGTNTDVKYTTYTGGVITTAKELPATVRNFTVVAGSSSPSKVTLNANLTVTGTLSVADTLTIGSKTITMADGSTLELKINGTNALDKDLVKAGSMTLIYNGATVTSTRELGPAASGSYTNPYSGDIVFKSGSVALQNKLTMNGNITFNGGNFDINGKDINVAGNVTQTSSGGIFINGGSAAFLNFTGANNTTLTLNGTWTVDDKVKFRLAKSSNEATVTLSGGNLNFADSSATLYFQNGVLITGNNTVILKHSDNGLQPVQGFDRSGVTGTNASHIVGNVKKFIDPISANAAIRLTRVEFPVGTAPASAPNYRPLAFQFTTLPTSSFNLTVSHVNENPEGTNGFPITSGNLIITNYPNFYWLVKSDLTLQPSVTYDIEARAEGYTEFETDGIQNIRFVRRFDGNVNNQWIVQGGTNYDNLTDVTTPVVIVRNATGAIATVGARFTFSQLNKAPVVSHPADITVNEGDTVNVTWTVSDPDIGQTVSVAIIQKPAAATFNATTNKLTWITGYTDAGTHQIIFSANDGSKTTLDTVVVTVNNKNQAPSFTATGASTKPTASVKNTEVFTFTYTAVDPDGETLTYSVANVSPAPAGTYNISASLGTLTFTPAIADAGKDFTFTIQAKDPNNATATTTTVVTVTHTLAKGDLNGSGLPDATDASDILKHVVGLAPITDPEKLYAADVNGDGEVGAYDAAWILYYVANGSFPTAKISAAMGNVEFERATSEKGVISLPLTLKKTSGVVSVYTEVQLTDAVEFKGVSTSLPEGWVAYSNFANGVLKIAMAGTTPLKDGNVANINLALKDKEAQVNLNASAKLNDQSFGMMSVKVKEIPAEFSISQNYPNPFNPTTSIKYAIPQDARVTLVVYDMLGQVVKTLVDQEQEAGYYTVRWDGTNDFGSKVSSGIYIYRIIAGKYTSTMKMNLLK